jgi:hypothetical protein
MLPLTLRCYWPNPALLLAEVRLSMQHLKFERIGGLQGNMLYEESLNVEHQVYWCWAHTSPRDSFRLVDCVTGTRLDDDLENVDLAVAGGSRQCIDGHTLDPFDALVERAALQDPEATNDLPLGLGKRAVDDLGRAAIETDPGAFGAWLDIFGGIRRHGIDTAEIDFVEPALGIVELSSEDEPLTFPTALVYRKWRHRGSRQSFQQDQAVVGSCSGARPEPQCCRALSAA